MDVAGSRTTIRPVDGLPMLHVEHLTLTGARRLVRAFVDRAGAVAILVLARPTFGASVASGSHGLHRAGTVPTGKSG